MYRLHLTRKNLAHRPRHPSTPYCLFSIAQSQILQGKTSHIWSKEVTTQLAKLYSSAPTDVLAELDEAENPDAVDPFTNSSKFMSVLSHASLTLTLMS